LADLLIDAHQIRAELLKAVKLSDFLLSLTERRRVGESFRHRAAGRSTRESELGIVARIARFGAMAGRLSAASDHGGNRARAQITQFEKFV
jgi:hypothetical protein